MATAGRAQYSESLLDHFHHPRGAGEVPAPDAEGRVVSPIHGDELRLTFAIRNRRIVDVRFQCRGCVVAIAAGSVATTLLSGRTVEEARALTDEEVVEALGGVPRERRVCSLIVAETARQALQGV